MKIRSEKQLYGSILLGCFIIWGAAVLFTPKDLNTTATVQIPQLAGRDYPIYWSAWRLLRSGQPIHDFASYPSLVDAPEDTHFGLHNPPWTAWLIAPIAALPFSIGLYTWQFLLFFCIVCGAYLGFLLTGIPRPPPLLLLLGCLFIASFSCWYYGQWTLLLTVIPLALIYCLQHQYYYLAGACLSIMTIKPHLFSLLVIAIGWQIVREKNWKILLGFTIPFTWMLGSLIWLRPEALSEWVEWVRSGHTDHWVTATPFTWLTLIRMQFFPDLPSWLPMLLPGGGIIVGACVLFRYPIRDWVSAYPILIGGSLIIAPYAWAYDFCLLLPWQTFWVATLLQNPFTGRKCTVTKWTALSLLLALPGFWVLLLIRGYADMHYLVWVPLLIVATSVLARISKLAHSKTV